MLSRVSTPPFKMTRNFISEFIQMKERYLVVMGFELISPGY